MHFCLYFTKTLGDNSQVRPPLSPHTPKHSQKSWIEFSFITFQCYKSQSQCLFYPQKLKNVPRVLLLQSVLPKKTQLFKSKMWCFFLKINQKVVEACVVVLLSQATLIFLDSLNLSRLSSSQEILKVRVDLSHALYLVVLNCKEHDFTRQTSLQVSLAINHTILLENLVTSTLKLLFLFFEFRILIFRRIRGISFVLHLIMMRGELRAINWW